MENLPVDMDANEKLQYYSGLKEDSEIQTNSKFFKSADNCVIESIGSFSSDDVNKITDFLSPKHVKKSSFEQKKNLHDKKEHYRFLLSELEKKNQIFMQDLYNDWTNHIKSKQLNDDDISKFESYNLSSVEDDNRPFIIDENLNSSDQITSCFDYTSIDADWSFKQFKGKKLDSGTILDVSNIQQHVQRTKNDLEIVHGLSVLMKESASERFQRLRVEIPQTIEIIKEYIKNFLENRQDNVLKSCSTAAELFFEMNSMLENNFNNLKEDAATMFSFYTPAQKSLLGSSRCTTELYNQFKPENFTSMFDLFASIQAASAIENKKITNENQEFSISARYDVFQKGRLSETECDIYHDYISCRLKNIYKYLFGSEDIISMKDIKFSSIAEGGDSLARRVSFLNKISELFTDIKAIKKLESILQLRTVELISLQKSENSFSASFESDDFIERAKQLLQDFAPLESTALIIDDLIKEIDILIPFYSNILDFLSRLNVVQLQTALLKDNAKRLCDNIKMVDKISNLRFAKFQKFMNAYDRKIEETNQKIL